MIPAILGALLMFQVAGGQEPPAVPVIGETIDVRVVNVEVVATSEGQLVRGLAAADFRLLVDGREVPIEFFTEVEEGTAAASPTSPLPEAETVGRSYLVFIDESFSVAKARDVVLENLERDLALMGPKDRMAVLAFDGSKLEVLCPWTSEKSTLAATLREARRRDTRGNQLLAQDRSLDNDFDMVAANGEDMGLEPGEVAALLATLGARVSPEARTQLGKTAVALAGALRGFEVPEGRKVMLLLSGGWSLGVAPRLYGPVVSAANQLGYTIYPVDVANPTGRTLKALDQLAAQTGGKVANSVQQDVFRTVVADSGSYYWLGFTPSWKADDRQHSIQVESRKPGVKVRARTSFPDLSKRAETLWKAESVLLFGGRESDRRLKIVLGKERPLGRQEMELPVTVGVPVEALALTPSGRGYIAEAPLAVAALDEKGGRAEIPTSKLRVAVKEPPKAGGYARFQTTLRLRRALQRLVFTVRDEVNGITIWQEVEVLQPEKGKR
ncbi:MAG TPA: VWA domain-containing protein [Thermoanaerobaculia bacterium]|nr:VWA domain-containing protein [Thermoanaerobaculia bacterium]